MSSPRSAPRRRLTSRDLLAMRFAGDVQISPDGRRVAWVERWIDPEQDTYRSRIMVAPLVRATTAGLSLPSGSTATSSRCHRRLSRKPVPSSLWW
ncbi:MAG: hypothetical protein GX496_07405, partial [Firmicutes bacterium]|nr:hypothetical protein [Bacillota bacterium]